MSYTMCFSITRLESVSIDVYRVERYPAPITRMRISTLHAHMNEIKIRIKSCYLAHGAPVA